MPIKIDPTELEAIEKVVARHPEGIRLEDVVAALTFPLSVRTLQRRLKLLAERGDIRSDRRSRGTLYFPVSSPVDSREPIAPVTSEEGIPLTATGRQIKDQVCRPLTSRTPVGYCARFLDDYIPNGTFYLTAAQREKLAAIGEVGLGNLPAGTYIRQIMHRLLIDLSWNSSRLEGNTYSLLETQRLLDLGEEAVGKEARETQMILNHKAAIELLATRNDEIAFNRYTVCNLHALLADNLLADPAACGRLRTRGVGIGGTVYHPLEVPQQIEGHFDRILAKASVIEDPFEQAFFVMVHLPYLQPFEDVNKRVSRLVANIPLIRKNLCPLSFIDVPQKEYISAIIGVYELNRVECLRDVFVWAYERSAARYSAIRQSLGDPDPFRLRYREQISEAVSSIIRGQLHGETREERITEFTRSHVPESDRKQFSEVVETELTCLHPGSIARYGLRPAEFTRWQKKQK